MADDKLRVSFESVDISDFVSDVRITSAKHTSADYDFDFTGLRPTGAFTVTGTWGEPKPMCPICLDRFTPVPGLPDLIVGDQNMGKICGNCFTQGIETGEIRVP